MTARVLFTLGMLALLLAHPAVDAAGCANSCIVMSGFRGTNGTNGRDGVNATLPVDIVTLAATQTLSNKHFERSTMTTMASGVGTFTGTASQSGTIVTFSLGSSFSFNGSYFGAVFMFANGLTSVVIRPNTPTTCVVDTSHTIASMAVVLQYGGHVTRGYRTSMGQPMFHDVALPARVATFTWSSNNDHLQEYNWPIPSPSYTVPQVATTTSVQHLLRKGLATTALSASFVGGMSGTTTVTATTGLFTRAHLYGFIQWMPAGDGTPSTLCFIVAILSATQCTVEAARSVDAGSSFTVNYGGTQMQGTVVNLPAGGTFFRDQADLTKLATLDASNVPTGTTVAYKLPVVTGTLATTEVALNEIVILTEVLPSGCPGVVSRAGLWHPRRFNRVHPARPWVALDALDSGAVSLSGSGYVTLAGNGNTYHVVASAPGTNLGQTQLRLWNTTGGGGTLLASGLNDASGGRISIDTYIATAAGSGNLVVRLEQFAQSAGGNYGIQSDSGVPETYAHMRITRIGALDLSGTSSVSTRFVSFMAPYASIASAASASVANADAAALVTFTSLPTNVFLRVHFTSLYSASRVWATVTGFYWLSASAQITSSAATATIMYAWLRVNGVDQPNSCNAARVSIAGDIKVLSSGSIAFLQAGDYFEVVWSSTATTGSLLAAGTSVSPVRPAVPSIIVGITRIPFTNYISLCDLVASRTYASMDTSIQVAFDTVVTANGMSRANTGDVLVAATGYYIVSVSIQATRDTKNQEATIDVHMRMDATDIANTNMKWMFVSNVVDSKIMAQFHIVLFTSTSQVLRVFSSTTKSSGSITSIASTTNPTRPAVPGASFSACLMPSGVPMIASTSTSAQVMVTANIAQPVVFDTDSVRSGVTWLTTSRLSITTLGTYTIAIHAHILSTIITTTVDMWMVVNGTPAPNTGMRHVSQANVIQTIGRTYTLRLYVGDTLEFNWSSPYTSVQLSYTAASVSPGPRPATPSASLVMYLASIDA